MKKNVAGQKIGAQMITAADGTVFTGAVTVYVTGDAGTQAVGSVGAGACTSEGNGYHTYAPAQAETNYDLIAFTFIGTGAVASTVQVYPSFPQTVDLSTGITAGTITTTTNVTTVNGLAANVITAASIAADAITDAKVAADVTIASVTGAVGSVTAGVTVTTNNDKTGYGLSSAAVQAIWDALTSALTTVGSIGKKLADWTIGTAQTGDSFARLGAPAGASVSADIAAVKAETAEILTDTGTTLDTKINAIKTKTDSLTFTVAGQVDSNVQYVNDAEVTGNGQPSTEWGPA